MDSASLLESASRDLQREDKSLFPISVFEKELSKIIVDASQDYLRLYSKARIPGYVAQLSKLEFLSGKNPEKQQEIISKLLGFINEYDFLLEDIKKLFGEYDNLCKNILQLPFPEKYLQQINSYKKRIKTSVGLEKASWESAELLNRDYFFQNLFIKFSRERFDLFRSAIPTIYENQIYIPPCNAPILKVMSKEEISFNMKLLCSSAKIIEL